MNIFALILISSFIHNELLTPSEGFDLVGIKQISLFETSVSKFINTKRDIFLLSTSDWLLDSKYYHFTYYSPRLKTGISASYFDFGKFEYYEKASSEPTYFYKPFSFFTGIYHSFKIDPELFFNSGIKYIYSSIWEYTSANFLLDAFLFFIPQKFPYLKIEGGIRNLGTASKFKKRYYPEPFILFSTLEVNFKKFDFKLKYLRGLWGKEKFEHNFKFAISYNGIKHISILTGLSYPDDIGIFSFGIQINLPFISLRYAYKPSSYFDDVHFIGITNAGI